MVPAANPLKTKRVLVGVPRSCSRSTCLADAAKNATHKGVGLECIDMDRTDPEQQLYISVPRRLDVRCGRGKGSFRQPGNLIFQDVVRKYLDAYGKADSKTSKGTIVSAIVNSLLVDHNLRFIKKDPTEGKWYVLSFDECHEKTGHAIRDQVTRMRRKQSLLLQEGKPASSTSTPTSCSSSLSSKDTTKMILKKKITKGVSRKAKNPVQKKKAQQPTNTQQQEMVVEKDEPDLPCFHLVAPEEEDDPWSDQFSYTETVDPSFSLGGFLGTDIFVPSRNSVHDESRPLDFHQSDESLAYDLLDQDVESQPQGTPPQELPSTPLHLRQQIESVEDMDCRSAVMSTTIRSTPVPRVSPETKRELYVLPSPFQTSHEIVLPSSVQTSHEMVLPSSVRTSHEIVADEEDPLTPVPRVSPETKRELYVLPSPFQTSHEIVLPSRVQTSYEMVLPSSVQTSHEIVADEEDPLTSIQTQYAQSLWQNVT